MIFRNAKRSDLKGIFEVYKERMLELREAGKARALKMMKWELKNCSLKYSFVAVENQQIAGYILAYCKPMHDGPHPHITQFAVRESQRRKGVGTKLMKLCTSALRKSGFKKAKLVVRMSNKPAIDLYKKLGFRKTKYLMVKKL